MHDATDLDPLIRMAVGHYPFEAIHPFDDGNGRTGRVLNSLFLIQEGLLNLPILYLSRYIIQHKDGCASSYPAPKVANWSTPSSSNRTAASTTWSKKASPNARPPPST